jgi:hypothetical protein
LAVWNFFYFFHILGIIIPTDFYIFQRGWNHQPENIDVVEKILGGNSTLPTWRLMTFGGSHILGGLSVNPHDIPIDIP